MVTTQDRTEGCGPAISPHKAIQIYRIGLMLFPPRSGQKNAARHQQFLARGPLAEGKGLLLEGSIFLSRPRVMGNSIDNP